MTSPARTLTLVGTPIGNLSDLSPAVRATLEGADKIYCENTHKAMALLNHLQLKKSLYTLHEGNEAKVNAAWLAANIIGKVVYMSEAGMPAINDPGFRLARECRKAGIVVNVVSGPSAFLNALVGSGLPSDCFLYAGFSPPKTVGRQKFYKANTAGEWTAIFYESCHRIEASLTDLQTVVGPQRVVSIAAELTKLHEWTITAPIGQIKLPTDPKGEWVICVAKEGYEL